MACRFESCQGHLCPCAETGRQHPLKMGGSQERAGSNPVRGIFGNEVTVGSSHQFAKLASPKKDR
jgi:hypothetical protein